MNARPLVVTGDMVVDRALQLAGFEPKYLRRSLQRTVEALDATRDDNAPDHAIRLKAAEHIFGMVGLRGRKFPEGERPPLALTIVIGNSERPPRHAIETNGGVVRFGNSERSEA